jgi:translation initiation factor IF-2
LIDDRGRRVKQAGPSYAVKCMGLSGVPEAGAEFRVMLNEKRARTLAAEAAEQNKLVQLASSKPKSLEAMMMMSVDTKQEQSVIIKADTQGSLEAIIDSFKEIKSEKVTLNVISEGIGNVSATDVHKAAAGDALIVGFNVGIESGVQQIARHDGVRISTFRIIYELMDFVKQRMLDLLPPEYKEVIKGHAEIRAIFNIGKTGRVAGCQMLDGTLLANGRYRIKRGDEVVFEGTLSVLKHFQQQVSEVSGSQECGILFNGFEGFAEGDIVECYVQEELPREL